MKQLALAAEGAAMAHGLDEVKAEVVLILDCSRFMQPMYKARVLQELTAQLLALSLNFDDDGVIPAYAFGDTCRLLGDLRVDDFSGYVDREVIRTAADFQDGCNYQPVIDQVCRYYFPEEWDRPASSEKVGRLFKRERVKYPTLSAPRAYPVFAMFVTSGDCQDPDATADAIRRSSRLPIFWQFIGLSPPNRKPTQFKFLEKLDKLGNTWVDNCGFHQPTSFDDPTALFDGLLDEFPDYLGLVEVQAMLAPESEGGRTSHGVREKVDDSVAPPAHDTALIDATWPSDEPAQTPDAMEDYRRQERLARKVAAARRAVADTLVGAVEYDDAPSGPVTVKPRPITNVNIPAAPPESGLVRRTTTDPTQDVAARLAEIRARRRARQLRKEQSE